METPPSLRDIQDWMSWIVTDPRGVADALAEGATTQAKPLRDCRAVINEGPHRSRVQRLDVYAEAYYARLLECLEEDYPALKRVLGEELFGELVAGYLEEHPSKSYTAAELGARLPDYLANDPLATELPYLPDLARLEWAIVAAYTARERPPLDLAALAKVSPAEWPRVRLKLDASVALIRTAWNVDELRTDDAQTAAQSDRFVLVWREGEGTTQRVRHERLGATQFHALELMSEGASLGEVCDALEARIDVEAPLPPLMEWFKIWVRRGIIREASAPRTSPRKTKTTTTSR